MIIKPVQTRNQALPVKYAGFEKFNCRCKILQDVKSQKIQIQIWELSYLTEYKKDFKI